MVKIHLKLSWYFLGTRQSILSKHFITKEFSTLSFLALNNSADVLGSGGVVELESNW